MNKDCVVRFRCTEVEKRMIEMMAAADPYADSVSEYLLDLVSRDAEGYREIEIEGVIIGRQKSTGALIEKKRFPVGTTLVNKYGMGSKKEYTRLREECEKLAGVQKSGNRVEMQYKGKALPLPFPLADVVKFIRDEEA